MYNLANDRVLFPFSSLAFFDYLRLCINVGRCFSVLVLSVG